MCVLIGMAYVERIRKLGTTMDIPLQWELEETIRENNGHTPIMGISVK